MELTVKLIASAAGGWLIMYNCPVELQFIGFALCFILGILIGSL